MRKRRNTNKNNKNRRKMKKQLKNSKEKNNKPKQTIMRIYDDFKIYMDTCLTNLLVIYRHIYLLHNLKLNFFACFYVKRKGLTEKQIINE